MQDSADRGLETGNRGRIAAVDAARGVAIVMMLAYHLFFDLWYFGIADFGIHGLPLTLLQYATGTLFVLIAGVSLTLSESRNRGGYAHHAKRAVKLAAAAALITAATWVYPHGGFIQFGIIHMLALSTLTAPLFFGLGRLNALAGALAIAAGMWAGTVHPETHALFWLGFTDQGYYALDHYAMLPWFGVVLMGMGLGQALFPGGREPAGGHATACFRHRAADAGGRMLSFLGRNSLAIYLLHQPVLAGLAVAWKLLAGAG